MQRYPKPIAIVIKTSIWSAITKNHNGRTNVWLGSIENLYSNDANKQCANLRKKIWKAINLILSNNEQHQLTHIYKHQRLRLNLVSYNKALVWRVWIYSIQCPCLKQKMMTLDVN
jgi:hypothetical protein